MKILIIGNGGREHAMAWKIAQSPHTTQVYVAPGNAGTALEPKVTNIPIDALDFSSLKRFAKQEQINFTIVGPEAPLAAGIVNEFTAAGLRCLGPSREAALLEASKAFSKAFMLRHQIPTASFRTFTNAKLAKDYLHLATLPIVLKADGLAGGKGVFIVKTLSEGLAAIDSLLVESGQTIVIEEFLTGEEVSFMVLVDGQHSLALATSKDHKTRDDGDQGPNTGGMGAYSPSTIVSPQLHERILDEIIHPTVRGMAAEGRNYTGFLYAGLMITPAGDPKVLEFNCRLGDPETQVILLRLNSDLVSLCQAFFAQQLYQTSLIWDPSPALGVVLASEGYPDSYGKGDVIEGLNKIAPNPAHKIFHAGTIQQAATIRTSGGRVLCVAAKGETLRQAREQAYHLVQQIHWPGMFCRRDIGAYAASK